jgi:hypothetical protein
MEMGGFIKSEDDSSFLFGALLEMWRGQLLGGGVAPAGTTRSSSRCATGGVGRVSSNVRVADRTHPLVVVVVVIVRRNDGGGTTLNARARGTVVHTDGITPRTKRHHRINISSRLLMSIFFLRIYIICLQLHKWRKRRVTITFNFYR